MAITKLLAALAAAVTLVTPFAQAQAPSFPKQPVTLVVPFPAGGPTGMDRPLIAGSVGGGAWAVDAVIE